MIMGIMAYNYTSANPAINSAISWFITPAVVNMLAVNKERGKLEL